MITETGRKLILSEFLTPTADVKTVHLLKDLPAGSEVAFEWDDVDEADFDGYAAIAWAGESTPVINGDGLGQWDSETGLLEWERTTTGAPQEIKAICLTATITGVVHLIDVTRFSPTVTVENAGDQIKRTYNAFCDNYAP